MVKAKEQARREVHDAEPARLPEGAAGGRRQEGDEYPRTQPQKMMKKRNKRYLITG